MHDNPASVKMARMKKRNLSALAKWARSGKARNIASTFGQAPPTKKRARHWRKP